MLGAAEFLEGIPVWKSAASVKPPNTKQIASTITKLATKPTATGPDGIPYYCWIVLLQLAADILFEVNMFILNGGIISVKFNEQFNVFIPKSSCQDHTPRALDTRPLGLKNSCPKILASSNSQAFNKVLLDNCAVIQRAITFRSLMPMRAFKLSITHSTRRVSLHCLILLMPTPAFSINGFFWFSVV